MYALRRSSPRAMFWTFEVGCMVTPNQYNIYNLLIYWTLPRTCNRYIRNPINLPTVLVLSRPPSWNRLMSSVDDTTRHDTNLKSRCNVSLSFVHTFYWWCFVCFYICLKLSPSKIPHTFILLFPLFRQYLSRHPNFHSCTLSMLVKMIIVLSTIIVGNK